MVQYLLEAHNVINNNSYGPVIQGSLRRLTTEHPQLLNQSDNKSIYALHATFQCLQRYTLLGSFCKSNTKDVIVLLQTGADLAVQDARGNTALHYLANGLAEMLEGDEQRLLFQAFLEGLVDVNALSDVGQTPDCCFGRSGAPGQRPNKQEIYAEVFERADVR
jgi:hypothetical protein